MAKYQRRPTKVDAVQWFKDGDHPDVYCDDIGGPYNFFDEENGDRVDVDPGDWIVTMENGTSACYSNGTFNATFEPAKEQCND